jgi:hypothetical protein
MNQQERAVRDAAIMKMVRAGFEPLAIAKKHRLTVNRVNQIIERERCNRETRKRKRSAQKSGVHAATAK